MTDDQARNIGKLAYIIFKENPELSLMEAIEKAREMIENEEEGLH